MAAVKKVSGAVNGYHLHWDLLHLLNSETHLYEYNTVPGTTRRRRRCFDDTFTSLRKRFICEMPIQTDQTNHTSGEALELRPPMELASSPWSWLSRCTPTALTHFSNKVQRKYRIKHHYADYLAVFKPSLLYIQSWESRMN